MKILSLSLDPLVLQKGSVVASRSTRYAQEVESYSIIVPSLQSDTVIHSKTCTAYGTGGGNKLFRFIHMWRIASRLIVNEGCDVISSQDTYFFGLLGWMLAKKYHLGLEVQVLGIEKLSFVRKYLSVFVLARAGSIRVLSLALEKRVKEEFNIQTDKTMLVPIYVDVSSLGFTVAQQTEQNQKLLQQHIQDFHTAYDGRFNIVTVSRLVPIKNFHMQFEAIKTLCVPFPEILLHIVGDGPLRDTLERDIEALDIQKHVVLHGFKSGLTLSPFFTETDCFVLTSDFEGYGMVVIEAATAGLPIVMTDVGCAGEVIIDKQSGLVIPVRNVQALVVALTALIENQVLRTQLSLGAKNAVTKLPTFDEVVEKYVASWQQAKDNTY